MQRTLQLTGDMFKRFKLRRRGFIINGPEMRIL